MKEFEIYDEAAEKFYRQFNFPRLPLLTSDFHQEGYQNVIDLSKDLLFFNKASKNWKESWDFKNEILEQKKVIVLTDPDLKISYTSANLKMLNGYNPEEVLGNTPKMFQGAGTCSETSRQIGLAIKKKEAFEVKILNYKKDKSTYICHIKGFPVYNKKGKLINFIAFEAAA